MLEKKFWKLELCPSSGEEKTSAVVGRLDDIWYPVKEVKIGCGFSYSGGWLV
jgi:hypothetical protein